MRYFLDRKGASVAKPLPWAKSWPPLPLLVIAMGLGLGFFHSFRQLPALWIPLSVALPGLLLVWKWRPALLLTVAAGAFAWGIWQADLRLAVQWPVGQDFSVRGRIVSIPQLGGREYRFLVAPEHWPAEAPAGARPDTMLVHGNLPEVPVVGQRWQLRLHSESLASLPGSPFADLARQRFWAREGGVARLQDARLLPVSRMNLQDDIAVAREAVLHASNMALDREAAGFVQALSIGVGNQLPPEIWQVYRDTGTAHLLVISGSHVAAVAGLALWLGQWLWRRIPWLVARWPAQTAGVLCSIPAAWGYASFAGMQIPGERAAWMITAAALAHLLGRPNNAWQGLSLAALLIAFGNPGALVDVGFWLSLGAVAVLVAIGYGEGGWRTLLRSQWMVSIALMPLLAGLFGQVSLISPIANVLVIPLVEMLAVPLALLGAFFALLDLELLSRLLFHLVALEMDAVTALLRILLHIPFARVSTGMGRTWALLAAVLGLGIFFLPPGWPGRLLALLGMVPLLIPAGGTADLELRALDAGSGMLLFWQKGSQSGIFSANLWKAASRRSGSLALTAALRQQGVTRVDAWLRSDISAPQPLPVAARQWWPAGARDYPGGPPTSAFCRTDGGTPAEMHFLTLNAPVQPCIVTWGAGPDVLILGDADAATVHRLVAEHGAALHRAQAIFAPASLGNTERAALGAAAAQARVFYLGEGKPGTWTWQAGRLRHVLPPSPAYWQPGA